tara:strand:+ start:104 stop:685 length:582 start_codon:yes stop_codon:yes gene_type:complete
MYIGVVYLFHNKYSVSLKQILLFVTLVNLLSGPGIFLHSQNENSIISNKIIWAKKSFLKTLSLFPFYEYRPKINLSETSLQLLNELNICEKIVDDHIQFKFTTKEKRKLERGQGPTKYVRLIKWTDRHDPIEDKISDINYIRGLTARYETWSPQWDKKADLAKTDLSLDQIDLLKFEAKRISNKLKYAMIKFL